MNNYTKFLVLVAFALATATSLGTVNQKVVMEVNKLEERNIATALQINQSSIDITSTQTALAVVPTPGAPVDSSIYIAYPRTGMTLTKGLKSPIRWYWANSLNEQINKISIGIKNTKTGYFSWIKTLAPASGTLNNGYKGDLLSGAIEWAPSSVGTFVFQISAFDKNNKVLARSIGSPFTVGPAPIITHANLYLAEGGTMISFSAVSNLVGVPAKITYINGSTTLLATTTKPYYAEYEYAGMYNPRYYLKHKSFPSGYVAKIEITRNGTTSQYITDPIIVSF
ncbi:MAG: hypothetical protein AAB903_02555 [Patescibacteria group bacterium]